MNYKIDILGSDECVKLVNFIYKCFGDSYPDEFLYNEDSLRYLIDENKIIPIVAKNELDEIIGHLYICPSINIYCVRCVIVDPDCRGRNIFNNLLKFVKLYLTQKGIKGFYTETILINCLSQIPIINIGGLEVGFFSRRIIPHVKYSNEKRSSDVLIYYVPCDVNGNEVVKVQNTPYNNIVKYIFKTMGIELNIVIEDDVSGASEAFWFRQEPLWGISELLIEHVSPLNKSFWDTYLKKLSRDPVRSIYLNLSSPCLNEWLDILWKEKYFFAGVIPFYFSTGSALVLQNPSTFDSQKDIAPNIFARKAGEEIYHWSVRDMDRVRNR